MTVIYEHFYPKIKNNVKNFCTNKKRESPLSIRDNSVHVGQTVIAPNYVDPKSNHLN